MSVPVTCVTGPLDPSPEPRAALLSYLKEHRHHVVALSFSKAIQWNSDTLRSMMDRPHRVYVPVGTPDKDGISAHSIALASIQSPEDNVHNGEISPEEFDRLSLLLRPPTECTPEDSSPMDTSPSPFTGFHRTEGS